MGSTPTSGSIPGGDFSVFAFSFLFLLNFYHHQRLKGQRLPVCTYLAAVMPFTHVYSTWWSNDFNELHVDVSFQMSLLFSEFHVFLLSLLWVWSGVWYTLSFSSTPTLWIMKTGYPCCPYSPVRIGTWLMSLRLSARLPNIPDSSDPYRGKYIESGYLTLVEAASIQRFISHLWTRRHQEWRRQCVHNWIWHPNVVNYTLITVQDGSL